MRKLKVPEQMCNNSKVSFFLVNQRQECKAGAFYRGKQAYWLYQKASKIL
jgi:hypothetical protein